MRFEATQQELQYVFDLYATDNAKRPKREDIILLDGATLSSGDEYNEGDDDDESYWFRD